MDEETIRKEFEEWADKTGPYWTQELRFMCEAWLESARRADRKAREECAEICEKDFNLFSAAVIRATIPEE